MQISSLDLAANEQDVQGKAVFPVGALLAFGLVTTIFFLWGMSNNLTDILVQQFKKSFELTLLEAQLVQTAVFVAYGTMAIPAALLMRRYGYRVGLLTGLLLFGAGTLLFWPAAVAGKYAPFLLALFIVGCGQSILETAANPLIAQFGPPETSARRLSFAQSFNPPGSMAGVLFGTWFIFSGVELPAAQVAQMRADGTYAGYLHSEIMRVVPVYVGLGVVLVLVAVLVARVRFPAFATMGSKAGTGDNTVEDRGSFRSLLRYPHLFFAVAAQFFYVGTQVATWSTFIPYMKAYTSVSERTAGYYLTGSLVALAVGRAASTWLMQYVAPARLLVGYSTVNVLLLAFAVARPGMLGSWALVATSLFMSIMFPTIFALGVKDLGPSTKLGGSLIVMAILGGAVFPPLLGVIVHHTGSMAMGYVLPLLGYVVVGTYGAVGANVPARALAEAPQV